MKQTAMLEYDKFHTKLKERLARPLPGESAQILMSAQPENKIRFKKEARLNARNSGVLVLFYRNNGEWNFPLIVRKDYKGVHSGQVAFPGGRMEKNDRNIIETAIRETKEEIGVPEGKVQYIGQLSELYIPVSNHLVYPSVAIMPSVPEFIKEEREVERIFTASLSDLLNPQLEKRKTIEIKGYKIDAPYFDFKGEMVWGATAMILSELKTIIKELVILR